ncbi:MAG: hypothetical protein L0G22_12575, partial [Propionibacteriaceae bacterium]|nr:hypothetical protein [Propionibacteriaceae bacterium]
MAQAAPDQHARRVKELSSQIRKMRGWIASDPSQAEPLVDALNELTALRLLTHQWLASFADAQDALAQAGKLVAFHGSVGPFTPLDDGARFLTATTHVAVAQAGGGQPAGAAQTVAALRAWRG